MTKKFKIKVATVIVLLLLVPLVIGATAEGGGFDVSTSMTSGGQAAEDITGTGFNTAQFVGQETIGDTRNTVWILQHGLAYMIVETAIFVSPPVIISLFNLIIEDFGIEWVALNWT